MFDQGEFNTFNPEAISPNRLFFPDRYCLPFFFNSCFNPSTDTVDLPLGKFRIGSKSRGVIRSIGTGGTIFVGKQSTRVTLRRSHINGPHVNTNGALQDVRENSQDGNPYPGFSLCSNTGGHHRAFAIYLEPGLYFPQIEPITFPLGTSFSASGWTWPENAPESRGPTRREKVKGKDPRYWWPDFSCSPISYDQMNVGTAFRNTGQFRLPFGTKGVIRSIAFWDNTTFSKAFIRMLLCRDGDENAEAHIPIHGSLLEIDESTNNTGLLGLANFPNQGTRFNVLIPLEGGILYKCLRDIDSGSVGTCFNFFGWCWKP